MHTYESKRGLPLAANLEENEKIKAELAPTKINEPKTPFHAPYSEEDEVDLGELSHEGRKQQLSLYIPDLHNSLQAVRTYLQA
jgi:hypothetical protein